MFFREHFFSRSWSATFCHYALSLNSYISLCGALNCSADYPEDSISFTLSGRLLTDMNSLIFTGRGPQVVNHLISAGGTTQLDISNPGGS